MQARESFIHIRREFLGHFAAIVGPLAKVAHGCCFWPARIVSIGIHATSSCISQELQAKTWCGSKSTATTRPIQVSRH